jgi:hypothetical protein
MLGNRANQAQERFGIEYDKERKLARVVDFGTERKPTNIPLTGWVVREPALVMRFDYYMGHLTP